MGSLLPQFDPIIKITDLHFRYKKAPRPVFQGLNLTVRPGERLAILGPSEAGKSTLALCLQGLIPRMIKGDFRGAITVDGALTTFCRPRQLAGRVGILFQDFEAQLFTTRVDQEVAFGPENLGLPREELRRRVAECLALAGLSGLDDRDPATLSGGQRQLLALAAVLAAPAFGPGRTHHRSRSPAGEGTPGLPGPIQPDPGPDPHLPGRRSAPGPPLHPDRTP